MNVKQVQDILNAAVSAIAEMDKWRRIAQMMSHFDTKPICKGCKCCDEARIAYMDASLEYEKVEAQMYQAFKIYEQITGETL